jgi:hypothetical protein
MTSTRRSRGGALIAAALTIGSGVCAAWSETTLAQDSNQSGVQPGEASARNALAAFQTFTQYPPESQPLTSSNWDLLHPWTVDSTWLPMLPRRLASQLESLQSSGLTEEEKLSRVALPASTARYRFQLDRVIVAGTRDELRASLAVIPDWGAAPLQIHIAKSELIGDDDFGSLHLGAVPFSCHSDTAECTFRWKAPAPQKQYWGILTLQVTLTVAGMPDEFLIRQSFYSSPQVAGRFTGRFTERLENGSLVIDAGVDVQQRMLCFMSANLYSKDKNEPTHHAQRRLIVDPTMKTLAFSFFGKIFRDSAHAGAFRLQDLSGQCENLPYPPEWSLDSTAHKEELQAFARNSPATREPSRVYFEYNNYSYTTHSYPSSAFSDRAWVSPASARKMQMYQRAVSELDNPAMEALKQQLRQVPERPK